MFKASKAFILIVATLILLIGCSQKHDFNETTTFVNLSNANSDYTITKSGNYNISGTLKNAGIKVETEGDVTIILSGVEITNESDEAIKVENGGLTTIKTAAGTINTISGGGDASINSKSNLVLDGSGSLAIVGTEKHGIECDGDLTINGGTIKVTSYEHGLKSESVLTILGGDIDIVAQTGKGIKAEKEFLAENGNVKIYSIENEGLESKGALTINGGTFDITAGEDGINAGTSDNTTDSSSAAENAQPHNLTQTGTENSHLAPNNTDATTNGGKGTGAVPPEDAQPDRFRPGEKITMDGEGEPTNSDGDTSQNTEIPKRPERSGMSELPEVEIPEGELPEKRNPGGEIHKREFPEGEIPMAEFDIPEDVTSSGSGIPFSHERQRGGMGGGMGRINADSVLTINGGYIKINCLGDGIDSNGTLSINGGTIIIDGPENSGNGPLDSDGEMRINGGTVLTASSKGMTQMPQSMTQGILNVYFDSVLSKGDEIVIMDSNDKIISEHAVERICEMLIFTSPDISDQEEYTVYVNGTEHSIIKASNNGFGGFGGPGKGGMGFRRTGFEASNVETPHITQNENE